MQAIFKQSLTFFTLCFFGSCSLYGAAQSNTSQEKDLLTQRCTDIKLWTLVTMFHEREQVFKEAAHESVIVLIEKYNASVDFVDSSEIFSTLAYACVNRTMKKHDERSL